MENYIHLKEKNMTFTWKYIFMYGPFSSHVKDLPTAFLRKVPNPQEDVFMEPWIAKQPLSLPPNSASEKTTKKNCTLCTVSTKMYIQQQKTYIYIYTLYIFYCVHIYIYICI